MLDIQACPGGTVVKNLPANAGDAGGLCSIPGSGRSPGVGNSNPLQYSCLENSMDRGVWWATVHGVKKNKTWLRNWVRVCARAHTHTHIFWMSDYSLPVVLWVFFFFSSLSFWETVMILRDIWVFLVLLLRYIIWGKGRLPKWLSGKESTCNAGDMVRFLSLENPLAEGSATHSSILAWRIPWTKDSPWDRKESDKTKVT